MTEIQLGKGRHNAGLVNTASFKGGIKRDQLKSAQQQAIFDMVDKDKNGVLDADEMQKFSQQLETAAGNEKLSKREAGNFLKQNNLKDIDKKEVFQFVNQLVQGSENIEKSQVLEENGQKTILITYKDGSQETINPDKTSQIATTDSQSQAVTTKFYDENKALTKESITQQNGDSEVTTFADNQPQQKTITLANGTKTTVIDYKDGKEATSTVTEGATISTFDYIDGKPRITKKVIDKGNGGKAESSYVYNENGSVTETTQEADKRTVTVLLNGKPQEITITEGNKSTHQVYTENGMIETINDPDNKTEVLTKYNTNGQRLAQGKVVDGKQYEVAYDGQGNTTGVVVQNGESIDVLAKKFGCKKEDIINANKELLNGKKYFNVGDTIKIPREVDADHKALQNRKTSEEAKAEYARDAQKRAEAEARRKAENAQLKALGLQNRKDAGKTWTKDGKKYTVVGNAAYNRKIVKDSKGKIHVFANGGKGVDLKLNYVGADIANVRAGKKRIVKNGTAYYVEGKRKGDKHGRYNVSDWHGNQYTLSGGKKAGEFDDRTILRNNYVKASDTNDAGHGTKTYLKDGSTSVTVNGETYYFDKNGNSVDGNKKSTEIANAIKADLDKAANDKTLGFIPDTDETLMSQANAGITDKVILAKINVRYAAEGYKPNDEYKTAYEAFQGTELQRNEVYVNNAALVKNGAIQNQARRNEILYTNVIQYGNKSENLHAGLDAISTREDFDQLNTYANRANAKRGYQAQFKNQSALNTFIYGQTGGDAEDIKAANDALIDPNEDFLTQEEITQTRAEEGIYFLQKAKSRTFAKGWQADDLEKALSSNNGDVYRKMDELLAEKNETPIGKLDFLDYDQKSRLVSAGYGNFSNDELANLALENLKWKKRAISTQNSIQNEINSSVTGNSGLTQSGRLGDAGQSEGQATSNIYALLNTKEAYDKFMKLAERDPELKSLANSIDKSKLRFTTTTSNLSQDQINTNKSKLEQLKTQMAMAERYANNTFASEGVKKSGINAVREAMGLGITRSQLNTILRNAGYNINALELAAEGKLTDGNGKVISYNDLEKIIKSNIKSTEEATQTYQQHQVYGEIVTDTTAAIATMPLAGGAIGTAAKGLKYAKTATALGTGLTMGAETYGMDRLDQTTSVSGDTMQARQASRDKAIMASVTTAAGMRIGMSTSALDKNIAQRILGAGIDITTDVGVASGVEYSQTGEVSEDGLITNLAFSAVGNVVGHSMGKRPAPTPEARPKTKLDITTSDGTRMPGGKLADGKAELNTVTGQLDSAIAANKGLSGEELATARAFMNKSNSISELETLIAKMNGSKSIKKSNAARKLISDMQAKVDMLKAKQIATASAQTSAPAPKTGASNVEEIATQTKNPTPVKPQEKPPVATISVEKPTPKAGTSNVEARTGVSSITNNTKYNNPRLNKYKTNKNKPLVNHEQFYQDNAELFKGTKRSYGTVWQQYTSADKHHGAWKMHMYSVDEHDWQQMAETLIPYLKEHGIEWKTFNPDYSASYLNNSKQRGKAFTIYPRDNAHMKQIATDLDYIIRNNNLNTTNSNIIGDRAMGSTGRLFYRYEFNSGKLQNEILDLSNPIDVEKYYQRDAFGRQIGGYYDANRGEGRYLANDMTPADDPWLNFDPSDPNSQPNILNM